MGDSEDRIENLERQIAELKNDRCPCCEASSAEKRRQRSEQLHEFYVQFLEDEEFDPVV